MVFIIESFSVFSKRSDELGFNPVDVSVWSGEYLMLPRVWDSTLRTLPPLRRNNLLGW